MCFFQKPLKAEPQRFGEPRVWRHQQLHVLVHDSAVWSSPACQWCLSWLHANGIAEISNMKLKLARLCLKQRIDLSVQKLQPRVQVRLVKALEEGTRKSRRFTDPCRLSSVCNSNLKISHFYIKWNNFHAHIQPITIRRRLNAGGNRNFLFFQDGFPAHIPCKPQVDVLNAESPSNRSAIYSSFTNVAELQPEKEWQIKHKDKYHFLQNF